MLKRLLEALPPFFYVKAFWEALSLFAAGALALCAYFGWLPASWAVSASVIAGWIYAILHFFRVWKRAPKATKKSKK